MARSQDHSKLSSSELSCGFHIFQFIKTGCWFPQRLFSHESLHACGLRRQPELLLHNSAPDSKFVQHHAMHDGRIQASREVDHYRRIYLLAHQMRSIFLVLLAKVFQQVGVQHDELVQRHGPGRGVRFGIVDSEFNLEIPIVHAPEALG